MRLYFKRPSPTTVVGFCSIVLFDVMLGLDWKQELILSLFGLIFAHVAKDPGIAASSHLMRILEQMSQVSRLVTSLLFTFFSLFRLMRLRLKTLDIRPGV
jgi:hypothetical protein